jgi:hypothetical protein
MGEPRDEAAILAEVKSLAVEYYALTRKPLGVTGEIAEFEAARCLGLELEGARSPGYDAVRMVDGEHQTIQIKGRWKRAGTGWGKVPSINTTKPFDYVMLVLLKGDGYTLHGIWEMPRQRVIEILDAPGSRSRNERRAMNVAKFCAEAARVWPPMV